MRRSISLTLFVCVAFLTLAFAYARARSAPLQDVEAKGTEPGGIPAIIFTATPEYRSPAAIAGHERFPRGAQLMILRDGHSQPLVPGFAASADANLSFDGATLLFAGKRGASDPWQIWETSLSGSDLHRVLTTATDAIRPMWMPGGRLVYAVLTAKGFRMETAALNGSGNLALTYAPGNFIPNDVLRDGRVLFESGFPLSAGAIPEMFLVYADGSGVESVRCDHGAARAHGREMQSGDIVFTHGRRLARFTSALADEAPIAAPTAEYAGDVAEMPDGKWLLSAKRPGEQHFALALWQPGSGRQTLVARDLHRDLVEPVLVEPRTTPNRHPSALHPWTTANLLALNARLTRGGTLPSAPATVEVEALGAAGAAIVVGESPVEKDGSFFVKVRGNQPVRFILLDAEGRTLRRERGWFWARGGEQRICVGCHTGPERAPDNELPQVLLRSTTPVDATGMGSQRAGGD